MTETQLTYRVFREKGILFPFDKETEKRFENMECGDQVVAPRFIGYISLLYGNLLLRLSTRFDPTWVHVPAFSICASVKHKGKYYNCSRYSKHLPMLMSEHRDNLNMLVKEIKKIQDLFVKDSSRDNSWNLVIDECAKAS